MTGYTVHTGSTEKFASGWDQIFGGTKPAAEKSTKSKKKAAPAAQRAKKKSAKSKEK